MAIRNYENLNLKDPIDTLLGVGEKNAKKLHKLGIFCVRDLLFHFPYRYDDLSKITKIARVQPGGRYTIEGKIKEISSRRSWRRHMTILTALVTDDTGSIVITWFNQAYLTDILKKGRTYLFAGQVGIYETLQMQNPIWELVKDENVHIGRIVPIYWLTAGIYPKWLRSLLKTALDRLPPMPEYLPQDLVDQLKLLPYDSALRAIHFPASLSEAENAKQRFSFDELLFYELKILFHKNSLVRAEAIPLPEDPQLAADFLGKLPFRLTASQKRAAAEITSDMARLHPANRLLSGDVGSGKTIVAALCALQTLGSKMRVALMNPTEILAEQHFRTFVSLPIVTNHTIGLATGSKTLLWRSGKIHELKKTEVVKNSEILIGTHALIQKNVSVPSLGLVIIDEQHRFGVDQRAALQKSLAVEGRLPHLLSMTATPIPRTLALTVYGDLNVSRITELPAGRRPVATELVFQKDRKKTYQAVEKQIAAGRQVFVICPLIDPSDKLGVKSATEEYARLKKEIFPKARIGLLHGRLKTADKDEVMKKFGARELDILVATTVVEVGIDYPNATVMLIEAAERFGLAQLHQLRGRVGRSEHQSYCYLLAESLTERSQERLLALTESNDGFQLAEKDLKLRGPGDTYGNLQSGFPQFRIADIFNYELLLRVRKEAENIIAGKYKLTAALIKRISTLHKDLHLE